MSKPIYVRAGDTFFTHSDSLLGRLIRWGERDKGEAASWANHTGICVEDGWIGAEPQAIIIEALWKTRRGPLKLNGTQVRVFRPRPAYTIPELSRFVAEAETYVGDKYGYWKLAGFLIKRATGIDVPSLFFIKSRPICSFLAANVNNAARFMPSGNFGMPPQAADPDSMLDYCISHPQYWEEIK